MYGQVINKQKKVMMKLFVREKLTRMISEEYEQIVGAEVSLEHFGGLIRVSSNNLGDDDVSLNKAKETKMTEPIYIEMYNDKDSEVCGSLTSKSARELGEALISMADFLDGVE